MLSDLKCDSMMNPLSLKFPCAACAKCVLSPSLSCAGLQVSSLVFCVSGNSLGAAVPVCPRSSLTLPGGPSVCVCVCVCVCYVHTYVHNALRSSCTVFAWYNYIYSSKLYCVRFSGTTHSVGVANYMPRLLPSTWEHRDITMQGRRPHPSISHARLDSKGSMCTCQVLARTTCDICLWVWGVRQGLQKYL